MRGDYGYFEEEGLGRIQDLKALGRLYAFVKPYRWLLVGSVLMVLLITGVDLAVPYVTKVAIDRYIVPHDTGPSNGSGIAEDPEHFLTVPVGDTRAWTIVRKYPVLFHIDAGSAYIAYDRLNEIPPGDLLSLRAGHLSGLLWATSVLIVVVGLNFALNFIHVMMMEYLGQRIMHDLRMTLFDHIQNLSLAFFSRHPVGRLVTRVTNDVQNMQEMFTSLFVFLFKDFFLLLGIVVILLKLDFRLALAAFTVLPVALWCSAKLAALSRQAFRVMRVKIAEINARFAETVGGMRVIQLFLQEEKSSRDFVRLNHDNYLASMREIHVLSIFMPLIEALGTVMAAIVIWYGGRRVLAGEISLGVLVAFISYVKMFFRPVRDLTEKYNILQNAMASAERILLILDNREGLAACHPPLAASLPSAERQAGPSKPAVASTLDKIQTIAFEDVSFAYFNKEPVLKRISFSMQAGETTAIVGSTGSGKTTLINLLVRFYDPDSGRILINGLDSTCIDPVAIRSGMALVMQDPFLFSDSIRNNIIGTRRHISENDLAGIIERSNCKSLIDRLPEGLETVLSEGGASISSGERQLISIARAFAFDPELIIFDEATSYIDSSTEVKIHQALANLMLDRTAIIIAHRLTTARDADRIIVLQNGRIVECGDHPQLMRRKGFYFRLNTVGG